MKKRLSGVLAAALILVACGADDTDDSNPFHEDDHAYHSPAAEDRDEVYRLDPPFDNVDTRNPSAVATAAMERAFAWDDSLESPEEQLLTVIPLFHPRLKQEWVDYGSPVSIVSFRLWERWKSEGIVFSTVVESGEGEEHPADTEGSWSRKMLATITGEKPAGGRVEFRFIVPVTVEYMGRWMITQFGVTSPEFTEQ